jgi:mRNA interferase MazF
VAYDRFDVVRVPFPFTDSMATRHRPALVVSDRSTFNDVARHSVMAMITSARHSSWPLDVRIEDLHAAGITHDSMVRFKLFTLDHRLVRDRLGRLGADDEHAVAGALRALLGPSAP